MGIQILSRIKRNAKIAKPFVTLLNRNKEEYVNHLKLLFR